MSKTSNKSVSKSKYSSHWPNSSSATFVDSEVTWPSITSTTRKPKVPSYKLSQSSLQFKYFHSSPKPNPPSQLNPPRCSSSRATSNNKRPVSSSSTLEAGPISSVAHRKFSAPDTLPSSEYGTSGSLSLAEHKRRRTILPWEYVPPPTLRKKSFKSEKISSHATLPSPVRKPSINIDTQTHSRSTATIPLGSPISSTFSPHTESSSPVSISSMKHKSPPYTGLSPAPPHLRTWKHAKIQMIPSQIPDYNGQPSNDCLADSVGPTTHLSLQPRSTLLGVHATGGQKKYIRQGYGGDWNQADMTEVISRLRSLR